MQAFGPCTAAAVQLAAALKTGVRIPLAGGRGGLRGGDALPAAQGSTGDGARCCRCAVPGALPFWSPQGTLTDIKNLGILHTVDKKTTRTRHATHPPAVPMVERAAEGGGGGDLADGPLDGQTNRGLNPRPRRAPAKAHTTRPSMSLTQYDAQVIDIMTLRLPWGWGSAP